MKDKEDICIFPRSHQVMFACLLLHPSLVAYQSLTGLGSVLHSSLYPGKEEVFMFRNSFSNICLSYKWIVTIAITLGMFMSLMDSTIVIVAIPQMQRTFGATIHDVQWVVTVYMLTQAAVIPATPFLVAKFGGKRTYVWTLSAFLLGSLLCGFAWNLPTLILFRLIQGIGGGILLPMVMTLLYQTFPAEERGTATSVMGVPLMLAPLLDPNLPANTPSGDRSASRNDSGRASAGSDGYFAHRRKACR